MAAGRKALSLDFRLERFAFDVSPVQLTRRLGGGEGVAAYERYAGAYHHDIWVVDLATGAKTPIVTSRVDDTTPSWSR